MKHPSFRHMHTAPFPRNPAAHPTPPRPALPFPGSVISLESGQSEQRRESSLKFQTRCVRCVADGAGYALGSVEGRVAMEFFDLAEDVQVGCNGQWLVFADVEGLRGGLPVAGPWSFSTWQAMCRCAAVCRCSGALCGGA